MTTYADPPAALLERMIRQHASVYEVMQQQLGFTDLTEAHRPLVPSFRGWLDTARQLVAACRELPPAARPVAALDDLLRAMNRSKLVAEDFDYFVRRNERAARGEFGPYRPLAEVMDELRSKP